MSPIVSTGHRGVVYSRAMKRSVIRSAALPALMPLLVSVVIAVSGCDSGPPERLTDTRFLLGTAVTVTVQQHNISRDVFAPVFDRTEEIQNLMSINESEYEETDVLRVNWNAGIAPVSVSEETMLVIQEGLRFGELTGGAFDITVAPLIALWGIGTVDERVPSAEEVGSARDLVDHSLVQVDADGGTVFLPRPGMGLDVGGIAKGYAVDEAARILREAGVRNAIVDFGGDIFTIGGRPDDTPWRIGIQHPSGRRNSFIGVLSSRDESVVSSGAYERFFYDDGIRYHHIFDPATGYPSESGLTSVTAVGPDAMTTDVLSTAIFVMGLDAGLRLLDTMPGYDGILATEDMRVYVTEGIADRFEVPGDEYRLIVHQR